MELQRVLLFFCKKFATPLQLFATPRRVFSWLRVDIDYIFIESSSAAEHKIRLKVVCQRLKQYALLIQKQK